MNIGVKDGFFELLDEQHYDQHGTSAVCMDDANCSCGEGVWHSTRMALKLLMHQAEQKHKNYTTKYIYADVQPTTQTWENTVPWLQLSFVYCINVVC